MQDAENFRRRPAAWWPLLAGLVAVLLGSGVGAVGQVFRAPQGTAENLRFEQAAGGVVTITYDLRSDDPNAVFTIVLEVAGPGGAPITPSSTSGDVGAGVRPGPGKRIAWAASRDVEELQINQFKFNVRASAGAGVPVAPTAGPPAAATARLTVTSTPAGAAVFVNGASRGTTPVTLTDVAAGTHKVRLERAGYLENQRDVTVTAGNEAMVDVRLTPASAPPTATGPGASGGTTQAAAPAKGGGGKKWLWIGGAGAAVAGGAVAFGQGRKVVDPPPPPPSEVCGNGVDDNRDGRIDEGCSIVDPRPTCTFAVQNLTNVTVQSTGSSTTRRVAETNAPCTGGSWSASSTQPWITVSPSSGSAAADVTISVAANAGGQRSGDVTVAGTTARVTQDALTCTFRANFAGGDGTPPNSNHTYVPGCVSCGRRTITVVASDQRCEWRVTNTPSWFAEVQRVDPGVGTRDVVFNTYEGNPTGRERTASFQVAGVAFTVTQCDAVKTVCP